MHPGGFYVEVMILQDEFINAMKTEAPLKVTEVVPFMIGERMDRLASVIDLDTL